MFFIILKYKSSLGYKTIHNCVMLYFIILIMTSLEILGEPEKKQINPWPKHNPIVLDRMMMNVWTK